MTASERISERIDQIKAEYGDKLFFQYDVIGSNNIITNGIDYIAINDKYYNGEYYSHGFKVDYFKHHGNTPIPIDNDEISVTDIILEIDEDEYEHIGYVIGTRPICLTWYNGKADLSAI